MSMASRLAKQQGEIEEWLGEPLAHWGA